jgi:hypothetical protein
MLSEVNAVVAIQEQKKNRNGRSGQKMMSCPVCKGTGVIRLSAVEALPWNKCLTRHSGLATGLVEERCWACGGEARLPVVDHYSRPHASS